MRSVGLSKGMRHVVSESPRGSIVVAVAATLIVLVSVAGLAIDGARLFIERRHAQNAADHSVVTAAHSLCIRNQTAAQAIADGTESAALNGYDNDGTTNTVTVDHLTGSRFEATIEANIPTTFAGVLGWSALSTHASATAACTGSGDTGPGAIYAGGTNCIKDDNGKFQLDLSGPNQRIYGGIHTNGDVNLGSAPNWWTDETPPEDPFTYTGTLYGSTVDNTFDPGYPAQVPTPLPLWPAGYAPSDVAGLLAEYEALARANLPTVPGAVEGTYFTSQVTLITRDGVWYTTHSDGMDLSSISDDYALTLVAENGPIKVSASNRTLTAHTDNLLALSNKTYTDVDSCDKFVIAISGGTTAWTGIFWGPGGLVEMSGSNGTTINGSLVGWAVRLSGSELTIDYDNTPAPGTTEVVLLQ